MTDAAETPDGNPDGDKPEKSLAQEVRETAMTVAIALLVALVLRTILFQPFTIPSRSMEPNLLIGDYIITSKFTYGYSGASVPLNPALTKGRILGGEPKRGDVIVFKTPAERNKDLIKRLVGLPGDRIQVQGGVLVVNGTPLKRVADGVGKPEACGPYAVKAPTRYVETNLEGRAYDTYDCDPNGPLDNTPVFLVPDGHYFFMGDNRDNSLDSRVDPMSNGVGYVPAKNLVGKAQIVLLSWDEDASIFKPWSWFSDARPGRFFKGLEN